LEDRELLQTLRLPWLDKLPSIELNKIAVVVVKRLFAF